MSLVAILAALRARKNANADQPAKRTLSSGLGLEARADGAWVMWRPGVEPSDKEVEVISRDGKVQHGYALVTSPGKGGNIVYRLVTPLNDDPSCATHELCPACRSRSLLLDPDGGAPYCAECGHGGEHATPALEDAISPVAPLEFERDDPPWAVPQTANTPPQTDAESDAKIKAQFFSNRDPRDRRPGLALAHPTALIANILFHFEAFGTLWTVKATRSEGGEWTLNWASLEPLEGNQGMTSGDYEAWLAWFALHGRISPLEIPERWRGVA